MVYTVKVALILTNKAGHDIAESTVAEPKCDLFDGPACGMAAKLRFGQTVLDSLCNDLTVGGAAILGWRGCDSKSSTVSSQGRACNGRVLINVHVAYAVGESVGTKLGTGAIQAVVVVAMEGLEIV